MSLFLGILLTAAILFPSLFSWIAPFFHLCLFWQLITKRKILLSKLHKNLAIGFSLFIMTGSILIGINLYLFQDISPWTYWIAGYISWFTIILLIRSIPNPANTIHSSFVAAGAIAGFGSLGYIVLFLTGLAPKPISIAGYQAYFGLDPRGFFAYSTSHLPLIAFLVPYFTIYTTNYKFGITLREKYVFVAMILAGLLSLRTVIWLIFAISFLYYVYKAKNYKLIIKIVLISLALSLVFSFVFDVDSRAIQGIYNLKLADKIEGEDPRYLQLLFWFKSFLSSPLIGHGLSSAEIIMFDISNNEFLSYRPGPIVSRYGYEILYAKLLSDIGLLLLPYIFIFSWLSFFTKTWCKNPWQVPALRGAALAMIIQSATNSYLQTSGWLFTLMLPMVFISSKSLETGYASTEIRHT